VTPLFPADALHVIAGGGLLVNAEGEILSDYQMNGEIIDRLWTLTTEPKVGLITGVGNKAYATKAEDQELFTADEWVRGVNAWENCQQCRRAPLVIVRPLTRAAEAWLQRWQDEGLLNYKMMQSYNGQHYADVTAAGVTKARMADEWAKKQGLDLTEIAAVGDGLNDLEVVQQVGLGVAMGNSVSELKQAADLVIGETNADGLAVWLESLCC
jgi:hydroxymethylpyrimidine pyrophosphatase-like HAD family hydrolase